MNNETYEYRAKRILLTALISVIVAIIGAAIKDSGYMPTLAGNLNIGGWVVFTISMFALMVMSLQKVTSE